MVRTIDITRAKAIEGWMTEPELVWLAEQAVEHRCIVEIGSYLGRSTRAMLDHTDGVVYAIDDWKGPRDVYMSKDDRLSLFRRFSENVESWIEGVGPGKNYNKLIDIMCKHEEAPTADLFPDMVFIDGSHEYEDVKHDITIWKDKLVRGGLLCGHDVHLSEVRQAVREILGDVSVVDNTSIWYKEMQ